MKTLIIHPKDSSTDFLEPIYANIPTENKTLITGGVTLSEVNELIKSHDEVVFCGHGSFMGLFSVGQFKDSDQLGFIINDETSGLLINKKKIISIWCYASMYAQFFELTNTFSTGMFISEKCESVALGFNDIAEPEIEENNICFAKELGTLIHLSPLEIYNQFQVGAYSELVKTNPISAYNFSRLYCSEN